MKPFLKTARFLPVVAVALVCASCASNPQPMPVMPVATIPPQSDGGYLKTDGFLIVRTPTEIHFDEHSIRRYPHTGYSIYARGTRQLIRYVHNWQGQTGESPATIVLPAGIYTVEARTVYHQPITFPVVIKPNTSTTVNIEGEPVPPKNITGEFYTLESHGRPIGWLEEAAAH